MEQDPCASISKWMIIAWSHDARKAKCWQMNITINSTAPIAINSWLLIANQPLQGTIGTKKWLERSNWQKGWLLCTRTCPGMHPYCPRTAPASHMQWNKKKNHPCGWLCACNDRHTKYSRLLPGRWKCIACQSLRATLECCPVMTLQQWWKFHHCPNFWAISRHPSWVSGKLKISSLYSS